MWWEPRSDEEYELRQAVDRLLAGFQEQRGWGETPLRGVGAGSPVGRAPGEGPQLLTDWSPLVLVDAAAMEPVPGARSRRRWSDLAEAHEASPGFDAVARLDPPPDCLVQAVGTIFPAGGWGGVGRGGAGQNVTVQPGDDFTDPTGRPSTVGLPASVLDGPQWRPGFLTVGHGVPAPGGRVRLAGQGAVAATGRVVYQDSSAFQNPGAGAQQAGDDIAAVALDPPASSFRLNHSGTQSALPGPPFPTVPVDLVGARSGPVRGQVNGALREVGDATWLWRDCWDLGGTQPVMQHGDSGSLAYGPTAPHPIFGHFVGGAIARSGQGFSHHWVQDFGQLLARSAVSNLVRF